MSATDLTTKAPRRASLPALLRLSLRDLRGVRGFMAFITCLALGVMTIAGVGSLAYSLTQGIAREGRSILGGDLAFILAQRKATPAEAAFLARQGTLSVTAVMRALARTDQDRMSLVEMKAVDDHYPLYGSIALDPAAPLQETLAEKPGNVFGAAADPLLFERLKVKPGARIMIGDAKFELRARILREPDKLAGGIGFGPRVIISDAGLAATGLVRPGSLVRFMHRLRLPAGSDVYRSHAVMEAAAKAFPKAGWDIRASTNASPRLERNIERFTQFLTLVGLTALLVGGVGVANSTKHYLDRKVEVIATLKSLGATGTQVVVLYFLQIILLASIGSAIGLLLGALLPFVITALFANVLPLPVVPSVNAGDLVRALIFGLLTAGTFALWPLGRAHDVPASALFRDAIAPEKAWPRRRYIIATAILALVLTAIAVGAAHDRKIAAIFVAAALVVFGLLRGVAVAVMAMARAAPRPRSPLMRLALANIHRPAALTPTVVLSLGLGMALLVTVVEIDGNLRQQFTASLPAKAPSFFFIDIPAADRARFDAAIRAGAPHVELERVPLLRGRIIAVNGVPAEEIDAKPDAAWVLTGDRGITYSQDVPEGSRVTAGKWWDKDYQGPPLVSLDRRIADGLYLKVGDTLTVNVLGRNFTARIASLRTVDWQSLGLNFVLVFSPGAFRGAPQTDVATVTFPDGGTASEEAALLGAVARAFPTVTPVPVKEAISAVGAIVANLARAVQAASMVTLISAVLVLGGALAAGHRHRVYDAVVLKTFGATRGQLMTAFLIEYLLVGSAAILLGVVAGSIAGWRIVSDMMRLPFTWQAAPALAAALGALAITALFGLIGIFAALGRKPAEVLRNL